MKIGNKKPYWASGPHSLKLMLFTNPGVKLSKARTPLAINGSQVTPPLLVIVLSGKTFANIKKQDGMKIAAAKAHRIISRVKSGCLITNTPVTNTDQIAIFIEKAKKVRCAGLFLSRQ